LAARGEITVGVAAVYFIAGKAGLALAYASERVAGRAADGIAATLILGHRIAPVFQWAFLVNLTTLATVVHLTRHRDRARARGRCLSHDPLGPRPGRRTAVEHSEFTVLAGLASTVVSTTIGSPASRSAAFEADHIFTRIPLRDNIARTVTLDQQLEESAERLGEPMRGTGATQKRQK
jgi:hypothetical protein